jgi:tetratricopeptide (TPR) repeat protein
LLTLLFLEAGFRIEGFISSSLQEQRNLQAIKKKGVCRIMCLGESTTQNQYPHFLEEILNQRNSGIKFSVIDKGLAGITTVAILSQLEANLNKYQPDIVVTMMGISDTGIGYYKDIPEANQGVLFRYCRVYRFGRLLYMHILKKRKKEDVNRFNMVDLNIRAKLKKIETTTKKTSLASEDVSKQVIALAPKDNKRTLGLEELYRPGSEEFLKKTIELNPQNNNAYVELGWLYNLHGRRSEAEQLFKKVLELNPQNDNAYVGLGCLYRSQGRRSEAEQAFQKAMALNPQNDWAYIELGRLYTYQGRYSEAEQTFKKALELNPQNDVVYLVLGSLYNFQGRYSEAEQLFQKAAGLNPQSDWAYAALAAVYCEMGNHGLSKIYAKKADSLIKQNYSPMAVNNYLTLKHILDKRKVKLVCVQYPVRRLASLKQIFKAEEGIIFVDNERIFKEAIEKEGYKEYFVDMYCGDFGHCTGKGNRLLAKNIADVILREIFGK